MTRRPLPAGIRRRGAVFTYTWRDQAGRQYSRKAGDTLVQAEGFKRRIDDQLALGEYRSVSTTTFATYATAWIEVAALEEQTRYRYLSILRRDLLPVFGGYPLVKIHPHLVRTWVAAQVAGPQSASSVRQHIAVLRSCLTAAQIDGHLSTLPLLGVKMPRAYSRQPTVLTLAESLAMVAAAPPDWQCAIATALFTGLRLAELLALTRDDLDLPAAVFLGDRPHLPQGRTQAGDRHSNFHETRDNLGSRSRRRSWMCGAAATSFWSSNPRRASSTTCCPKVRGGPGRDSSAAVTAVSSSSGSIAVPIMASKNGEGGFSQVRRPSV